MCTRWRGNSSGYQSAPPPNFAAFSSAEYSLPIRNSPAAILQKRKTSPVFSDTAAGEISVSGCDIFLCGSSMPYLHPGLFYRLEIRFGQMAHVVAQIRVIDLLRRIDSV